jgi:hypothetical protein
LRRKSGYGLKKKPSHDFGRRSFVVIDGGAETPSAEALET